MATGFRKLELAKRHLDRVLAAWTEPTDWDNLSLYGFYCLEAAVEAAALSFGLRTSKKHWEKVDLAEELHKKKGLPDIGELLVISTTHARRPHMAISIDPISMRKILLLK